MEGAGVGKTCLGLNCMGLDPTFVGHVHVMCPAEVAVHFCFMCNISFIGVVLLVLFQYSILSKYVLICHLLTSVFCKVHLRSVPGQKEELYQVLIIIN